MLDLYTPQTIGASTGLHDSPQLLSVKRATFRLWLSVKRATFRLWLSVKRATLKQVVKNK